MWIRWIGGRGWGDALLRWLVALLLPFAGLVILTEATVIYSLSTRSTEYMKWLIQEQGLRGDVFMLAAALPGFATALVVGIAMGVAITLLFRVQPLRIAAVAAVVPPLLLFAGALFSGDAGDAVKGGRFIALDMLMLATGIVLLPWLWQRRRRSGEAAARPS